MFQRTTEDTGDHPVNGNPDVNGGASPGDSISAAGRTEPSLARQVIARRLGSVLGQGFRKAADAANAAYHRQRRFAKYPMTPEEQRRLITEYTGTVTKCPSGFASGFTPMNAVMRRNPIG